MMSTREEILISDDDKCGVSKFNDRSSAIFGGLKTLESDYLSQTDDYKHDLDRHGNMRVPYSERSGRRDPENTVGFKLPTGHAPRNRNKSHPRHQPNKWTYYNLGDVTEEQLSERSNTQAAMNFLNSLEKNKHVSNDDSSESSSKHMFAAKKTDTVTTTSEKQYRNGTLCMEEYVVGGPVERKRKKPIHTNAIKPDTETIALGHLGEELTDCNSDEPVGQLGVTPPKVAFVKRKNKKDRNLRARIPVHDEESERV